MTRTRTLNHGFSICPGTYANNLVRHFVIGSPKPKLRVYPGIKECADDAVLTDEKIFDLSALLSMLQDVETECQIAPDAQLDPLLMLRDDVEEALACLLAPLYCKCEDESLTLLPEYSPEFKQFNEDLNNYILVLRLIRGILVPKLFRNFQCLVLGFTLKLARLRVLTGFADLREQGFRWAHFK